MFFEWESELIKKWYGKKRVTSYELPATSYELRVERLKTLVEIQKYKFKPSS